MEKKKILIVTTSAVTITSILKGQPKYLNSFFSVSIATSEREYFAEINQNENIEPYQVSMKRGINPLFDLYSLFKMARLLLLIKPDIVHSYTPKAGLITMIASALCGIPVRIHTFTGLIFPYQKSYKKEVLRLIDKLICACATTVIPEGTGVKNDLTTYNVTRKKLDILGNGNIAGIDTDFFNPDLLDIAKDAENLKTKLDINTETFVFTYIGRLNRDKGLDELVAAFQLLQGQNKRLVIVGPLDLSAPTKSETLFIINNSKNINWVGYMNDVRPALLISNSLVLPSHREGFPNVLIQAGAMKIPCISTAVSGANEIVEDGITGFIVPVKNTNLLLDKMQLLTSLEKSVLAHMGEQARKRVSLLFEQSNYREILRNFYFTKLKNINEA